MSLTKIKSSNIKDSSVVNADFSPTTSIPDSQITGVDSALINDNAFNLGLIGFQMAVRDGLTVFNLVDGVVDEFKDESGVDTTESSNQSFDNQESFLPTYSNFYTNDNTAPAPATTDIQAFWHTGGDFETSAAGTSEYTAHTYTAPPTAKAVDLLVVGGGGGGGGRFFGPGGGWVQHGGGGGAGGLVYIENFPVVAGGSYPITVGAGGKDTHEPTVYNGGDTTFTSPTPTPFGTSIIGEGGGGAGGSSPQPNANQGGSAGGEGWEGTSTQNFKTATQATNHPIPGITPLGTNAVDHPQYGVNVQGSYGNDGAAFVQPNAPYPGTTNLYRGGSGGGAGEGATASPAAGVFSDAGDGMAYDIADGSTPIVYAGGGTGGNGGPTTGFSPEQPGGGGRGGGYTRSGEDADAVPTNPLLNGTSPPQFGPQIAALSFGGGGGGGGAEVYTSPYSGPGLVPIGGDGGSGVVYVSVSQTGAINSTMTLISDTFTAASVPTTARIVVYAVVPDGISDFAISATRDNTTYNTITLTDEGESSAGTGPEAVGYKVFTGSTPLTGTASPQVQMRWKIVGSSLTSKNKIHGVSLQWK